MSAQIQPLKLKSSYNCIWGGGQEWTHSVQVLVCCRSAIQFRETGGNLFPSQQWHFVRCSPAPQWWPQWQCRREDYDSQAPQIPRSESVLVRPSSPSQGLRMRQAPLSSQKCLKWWKCRLCLRSLVSGGKRRVGYYSKKHFIPTCYDSEVLAKTSFIKAETSPREVEQHRAPEEAEIFVCLGFEANKIKRNGLRVRNDFSAS